ncbi:MAG: PhzF family phenazine biosynthesis isomerase [Gammaproteobacteria bacterium]|nr:PhzF family phenazine biosynthesis isomerase [Gammaproteobacteria bacterium]
MELTLYQIDAFASRAFEGNPAAICPLDQWLTDEMMQSIALENNLSETAFFVETNSDKGSTYHIRWFTPLHEVDLCGHATLASAYVIFNILGCTQESITFHSKSGVLSVTKNGDWLEMDFPSQPPQECETPAALSSAFNIQPVRCLKSEDYILVFETEEEVLAATPNQSKLSELDLRGVAITAKSDSYDFVARFFAPKYGIDEDPVTGSAFTQLIPYWSERLGKTGLTAKQISKRGGEVMCRLAGSRVKISGKAAKYMVATIEI